MSYIDEVFADVFSMHIASGACILAFDGLDEVPVEKRALVRKAIKAFHEIDRAPIQTLVTCRDRSYSGDAVLRWI